MEVLFIKLNKHFLFTIMEPPMKYTTLQEMQNGNKWIKSR